MNLKQRLGKRSPVARVFGFALTITMVIVLLVLPGFAAAQSNSAAGEEGHYFEGMYTQYADKGLLPKDFADLEAGKDYAVDEVLVFYQSSDQKQTVEGILSGKSAVITKRVTAGISVVKIPAGTSVQAFCEQLKSQGILAQPNYVYTINDAGDIENFDDYKKVPGDYTKDKGAPDDVSAKADPEEDLSVYVNEQGVLSATPTPNDKLINDQWHLEKIDTYKAWSYLSGYTSGSGVLVAIIDTGIDLAHPDLKNNIVGGACFTGENSTGMDNEGHGTHVAGIVAAQANNGIGVSGVAPGASLYAIKVLDRYGSGYTDDIISGVYHAVDIGADVMNMSYGSYYYDYAEEDAVDYAVSNGVVAVAASGNENTFVEHYPSDFESVIAVNATDINDEKSSFSCYGELKDISAPGSDIMSTLYSKTYASFNGTSMASPVVTGVVALMLDADPGLSVSEVKSILYSTTEDLGLPGKDNIFANGRVNAANAVMKVLDIGDQDTAYRMVPNRPIFSEIDYSGDIDWFEIQTSSAKPMVVTTDGLSGVSLSVKIFDSSLTQVGGNSGFTSTYNTTYIPDAGETYYFRIEGNTGQTGSYSLEIMQDVIGDTVDSAENMKVGKTSTSFIENSGDVDFYEFNLGTNSAVTVTLQALDGASYPVKMTVIRGDYVSTIYTGSLTTGTDVRSFTTSADDNYYVKVEGTLNASYRLSLVYDTNGSGFSSARVITAGNCYHGEFETEGDNDYFKFVPTTSGYYFFNSVDPFLDTIAYLYNGSYNLIATGDDTPIPGRDGYAYRSCYIYANLTAGQTYYYKIRPYFSDTIDEYSISLTRDDPNQQIAITDGAVRTMLQSGYYWIPNASTVPRFVCLLADYMYVKGLKDDANLTYFKNLETLYIDQSTAVGDVNFLSQLHNLKDFGVIGSNCTAMPDLSDWNRIESLIFVDSRLTVLPDMSDIDDTLEELIVVNNYIDFSDGSVSDTRKQALEAKNIEVYADPQNPLSTVAVTVTPSPMQTYEDALITATASSSVVDVGEGAEYLFEVKYGNEEWSVIQDWSGDDTASWYPDAPGTWYVQVSARVGGNDFDSGVVKSIKVMAANPAPISLGRTSLTSISKNNVAAGETVTITGEVDTSGLPSERYAQEYRVVYSTNASTWLAIPGLDWADVPTDGDLGEIGIATPLVTRDTVQYYAIESRVKGVQTTTLFDRSEIERVNIYYGMPLAGVTLDSVGDTTVGQAVPEGGITLTATATNQAGYAEAPTYRFAYRMEGSAKWAYIGKAFSEANTIQFVPKTEGTYYFKVEAQTLGRKTKAGDVWDYDYTAYTLSKTAEPVKGITNLTADKKDYVNGEPVTLTMYIYKNDLAELAEYQLLYSTNGKSFKPINKEYEELSIVGSTGVITIPELPLVKKDTIYYLKVQVRTIGRAEKEPDAFAMTQVEFKTAHPVEAGEVAVIGVGNDAAEQSVDAEGITLTATERANTEYRFAYQKLGDTKWSYVSSKWSTERTITFVPKTDGRYQFCVEARSLTRTTTDTTSAATGYYGLYYLSLGAESASVAVDGPTEFVNDLEGIDVPVIYSVEGNGTDTYDLKALYSTNGKSYKELYYVEGMGPEAITDASIIITLPAVKKDTHYWLKFEAKTNGHATADVFDTAEVDVYMVEPLTEMMSFESDAAAGVKLLPTVGDSLILTATANDDATYKFYYRLEGAPKWSSVSSKYVVENQAFFRPKTEGAYEFKAEATALGRKAKTADVSAELGEAIDVWFTELPAESVDMVIGDADADYIIGLDTEMLLDMTALGDEAGMEYQIVYSNNGGKSYKPLSAWQTLIEDAAFDDSVTCLVPTAKKDTLYLIKAQVRTIGRTTVDAESDPVEIWMLSQEREVTTELTIAEESYEYTDTIMANIAISEPASGTVEYQLQYSTDNKKWNDLSAHSWTVYNDGGAGSINVELDLAELNGDMTAYIKLNARMKNGAKIEDFAIDSFTIYNIAPVESAELAVIASGDEYVNLEAGADSGGIGHTVEYRYSYALAGQSKMTWVPFTSWTVSDEVTFTPSLSGDYLFMVEARNKGRLTVDATAEATNEDSGYYLKSIEDTLLPEPVPEPSAAPTPSEAPTVIPSAVPSEAPSIEPSTEPSASPSAAPTPELISSLEYATIYVLGEEADLDGYTEQEVAVEDILSVLADEDAPMILVQLGEDAFAVITGYEADEDGKLTSLTLTDQMGETILGGTEGILRAWIYVPAQPEISAVPSAEATPEPVASEAPVASESPSAQPSETPAV